MKKFTRFLALTLCMVMTLPLFACDLFIKYPEGEPVLKDEQTMFVGAYCAPDPKDSIYKEAAEFGITDMMVGGGDYWKYYPYDTEEYYKIPYELGEKYGINIIMHMQDTSYKALGEEVLNEIKQRENFAGFLIVDEPPVTRYDYYIKDYRDYIEDFPNQPYYINLLPNYAEYNQMGRVEYDEYLRLYKEKILKNYDPRHRILMCDTYPLMTYGTYTNWLQNLEQLRDTADDVGAKIYLFLQAQGFLGRWRQPQMASEITYQMYVYLAYGVKGFAYYPYRTPESSDEILNPAVVDTTSKKTYVYGICQQANKLLQKIDGVMLDFNWKGVIANSGTRNIDGTNLNFESCTNMIEKYGVLDSVSSIYDCIVGCFENEQGYQGFLATNFNDPLSGKEGDITLNFKKCNKAIVYVNGEPKKVDLKDGKLTQRVGAGEAIFVVPYVG